MASIVNETPLAEAAKEAAWYDSATDMIAARMPEAVKGAGYAKPGGNKPIDDTDEIFDRSFKATKAIREATRRGLTNPQGVYKNLNPNFLQQFGLFAGAAGAPGFGFGSGMNDLVQQIQQALADLGKNVTLTSPLSSGFVPFDLVSP